MNALPGSPTARTLKLSIMKSILYAGAALMIGASIYGFVDYKKNHDKKEFTGMYNETKHDPVTVTEVADAEESKDLPAPAPEMKSFAPEKEVKKAGSDKEVKAVKSLKEEEKLAVPEKKIDPGTTDVKANPEVNVKKKNKKIRREIFSRAPLRYEDDETEDEPLKPEDSEKVDTTKI